MITMTNLIEKTDSRYFSQTSDAPYDANKIVITAIEMPKV